MIKRFLFIVLSLVMTIPITVHAQSSNPEDVGPETSPSNKGVSSSVATSSASQLYNVNLYDGTATVNIPIYNYSICGLDLGISLGYDTHGIKVDQVASCAGLGWNLNAGGIITRKINGLEDEITLPNDAACGAWMTTTSSDASRDKELDEFSASFAGRNIRFVIDYLHGKVRTSPYSDIKIILREDISTLQTVWGTTMEFGTRDKDFDKQAGNRTFQFEIIDEHNNRFLFKPGNVVERHFNDTTIYYQPETWNLVQLITQQDDTVNYTYEMTSGIKFPEYKNELVRVVPEDITWPQYEAKSIRIIKNKTEIWSGTIAQIKRIDYPNGTTVNFVQDQNYRYDIPMLPQIDKIVVEQKLDNNIKNSLSYKLNFAYFHVPFSGYNGLGANTTEVPASPEMPHSMAIDYFGAPGITLDSVEHYMIPKGLRLKLKSISVVGKDGATTEPYYSFKYNDTPLPMRLSPSRDHYGYYNGKQPSFSSLNISSPAAASFKSLYENLSVIKQTFNWGGSGSSISFGMDKTPDINYMKACILEKITNASNGTIELFYKDHVLANKPNGYNGPYWGATAPSVTVPTDFEGITANDGLCIDNIFIKDGINPDNTVNEFYDFSDGQRFFQGGRSWVPYKLSTDGVNPSTSKDYYTSYVTPITYINNSNHGYSYAEIKKFGYNNQLLGSTKFHFTNLIWDIDATRSNLRYRKEMSATAFDPAQNGVPAECLFEYRMGQIMDITYYDQNHNASQKTAYEYKDDKMFSPQFNGYVTDENILDQYGAPFVFTQLKSGGYGRYRCFAGAPYLPTKKTDITYTSTGEYSNSISYTYTAGMQLETEKWTDEQGRETTNLYEYENFYSYVYNMQKASQTQSSYIANHFNYPVSTKVFKKIGGTDLCIAATIMEYKLHQWYIPGVSYFYYRPSKNYKLFTNSPVQFSRNLPAIKTVNEITQYDSKNNIIEVKYEDKDLYACSVWDTRIGKKIAAVRNARYDEIAFTSFEGTTFLPYNTPDDNKGNWNFKPDGVVYKPEMTVNGAITGKYYFGLNWSNPIDAFKPTVSGKSYVLTLWATAMPYVNAGNDFYTLTQQTQVGNWKLYTASFTGNGSAVRVWSNTPVDLDELRLYPAGASMTTTTYEPMFGPSSACDDRNNINYIEYDAMGRPAVTRDINRNILSATQTVIGGDNDN